MSEGPIEWAAQTAPPPPPAVDVHAIVIGSAIGTLVGTLVGTVLSKTGRLLRVTHPRASHRERHRR